MANNGCIMLSAELVKCGAHGREPDIGLITAGYHACGPKNFVPQGCWPLRQGSKLLHGPESRVGWTGAHLHLAQGAQQGKKF